MRAFKFLRPGGVGLFSQTRWLQPNGVPGGWVRASAGDPALCRAGVHACAVEHLPFWLAEELWEIELEAPVAPRRSKLVAPAGRLVARVEAGDEEAALAFMAETVDRIRGLDRRGYVAEAEIFCTGDAAREDPFGNAALSTMIAVEAAEHAGGHDAVRAERATEVAWLADRLAIA